MAPETCSGVSTQSPWQPSLKILVAPVYALPKVTTSRPNDATVPRPQMRALPGTYITFRKPAPTASPAVGSTEPLMGGVRMELVVSIVACACACVCVCACATDSQVA